MRSARRAPLGSPVPGAPRALAARGSMLPPWPCHPGGQTLYVTEGRGLVQSRGGEVIEVRPGDVIYTPPGEWHWHGAAPDHFMTHIAMWEVDDQGNSASRGAHVTDEEYAAA